MTRLYVLRPEPGASATVERAKAIGLKAVAMPLFAIEAVPWTVADAGDFDGLLLTSANAVREAGKGLACLRALPVHAVGDATAAVAREAGFKITSVGHAGVDALLGTVAPGMRLLHLCGEDRRAPSNPRQAVTSICVDRSRALAAPAIARLRGQVAAVHSPRAAERLGELADRSLRATVRLVAISAAAAQAAGSGWAAIGVAPRPDDRELLALAARLCQNPQLK
jgi:uroporphyrinogen-III synthase